jgi:hypothetical protein
MRVGEARRALRRARQEQRTQLTGGERIVGWSLAVLPGILAVVGVALLVSGVHGGGHAVGIALLILAVLVVAVPISPVMRAKARRREARAARRR